MPPIDDELLLDPLDADVAVAAGVAVDEPAAVVAAGVWVALAVLDELLLEELLEELDEDAEATLTAVHGIKTSPVPCIFREASGLTARNTI